MSFSPRRVRSAPSVALYECRLHRFAVKPAAVLRSVEGRVRKWRGVQRGFAQCYSSARGEVVVQAVVERGACVRVPPKKRAILLTPPALFEAVSVRTETSWPKKGGVSKRNG